MRGLKSQIFIDGGDPEETRQVKQLLGHVDGQTTNPTLVLKNPEVQSYLKKGKRLTQKEALAEYKKIVTSIAQVTDGPISIQVIGDQDTPADELLRQARVYKTWVPNGVVKFPITSAGLAATETFCLEHSVNLTLNFSQEQAAAVYVATKSAKYQVFISPFVGRLDDRGENGMDVVANTLKMYASGDGHVKVLTSSLRKIDHLLYALHLGSDAITVPYKIILQWKEENFALPEKKYYYDSSGLSSISYQKIPLDKDWQSYNIQHDLTDKGLEKFMQDWMTIIK